MILAGILVPGSWFEATAPTGAAGGRYLNGSSGDSPQGGTFTGSRAFGHLHDVSAPLDAVPIMLALTAVGLRFSTLFLRGMEARSRLDVSPSPRT